MKWKSQEKLHSWLSKKRAQNIVLIFYEHYFKWLKYLSGYNILDIFI